MAKIAKKELNIDNGAVSITFANGAVLNAHVNKLQKTIQAHLMLHGLSQKLGDSYAGAESPEEAAKFAGEVLADLEAGKWSTRTASPRTSIMAEAISRIRKMPVEQAAEIISNLDEEQVAALRKHKDVVAAMAVIRAERATAKAKEGPAEDLSALLA